MSQLYEVITYMHVRTELGISDACPYAHGIGMAFIPCIQILQLIMRPHAPLIHISLTVHFL